MISDEMFQVLTLPITGRAAFLNDIGREDVRFFLRGEWDALLCTVNGVTHKMPRHEVTLEFFIDARLIDMPMLYV